MVKLYNLKGKNCRRILNIKNSSSIYDKKGEKRLYMTYKLVKHPFETHSKTKLRFLFQQNSKVASKHEQSLIIKFITLFITAK